MPPDDVVAVKPTGAWTRARVWEKQVHASAPPDLWKDAALPACFQHSAARLYAMVGFEPLGQGFPRWHISLQHRDRVPTWAEVARAAHELRPGVGFVISVPPKSLWLNLHPRVIHLDEVRDPELEENWRVNAQGHEPS